MKRNVIISISSDIGTALAKTWLARGEEVVGTLRSQTSETEVLRAAGAKLFDCNLTSSNEIDRTSELIAKAVQNWDLLILAAGLQAPIGKFSETEAGLWEQSVYVNFLSQIRVVRNLLHARNSSRPVHPLVLFFAGGGTNNATEDYSAYTVSKVALIKMTELLAHEIRDVRFAILGPGWVKTKIHKETLNAKHFAGLNYERTLEKLRSDECVPMAKVVECVDWLAAAPKEEISGRNFSLVYDQWGSPDLSRHLLEDENMYKLRRHKNDRLIRQVPISEKEYKS